MRKPRKGTLVKSSNIKGLMIHRKSIKVKTNKLVRIGVKKMENTVLIEEEAPMIYSMRQIRAIAQKVMKDKGLTETDVRKTLGVKRYEK